jgi:hypothetical protein
VNVHTTPPKAATRIARCILLALSGRQVAPKKSDTQKENNQVDNINLKTKGGTSKTYILARLDRDGHAELAAKVRAGAMSANAVCRAAEVILVHRLLGSLQLRMDRTL